MRFSIFSGQQLPRPWDEDAEHRSLTEALQQVQLADHLGFHTAWVAEHHFLEERSHSSAPDVFLAAASSVTSDIRLGFGSLLLPPGYQHPARVAEAAATLDLLSGGRVELGSDESCTGAELAGFGVDREAKHAQWSEALEVVARMMVEEPFAGADGRWVRMPPRNVVPKPMQKPHPPLWVSCTRRETVRVAAQKGLGVLGFLPIEPEEARTWVQDYHSILESDRCVPAGLAVNPRVAVALPLMVHHDEAEAIERGVDGIHFSAYARAHYSVFGDHQPGETSVWQEFQRRRDAVGFAREPVTADGAPLSVKVLREGLGSLRGAIGTPTQVLELASRYEAAGVDELIFCLPGAPTRHEHVCEALELFATEVMPEFAERHVEWEAEKATRLGGAIKRALKRREPPWPVDPEYRFGPHDSGSPAEVPAAPAQVASPVASPAASPVSRRLPSALRQTLEARGEQAFRAFVARSDDQRLGRLLGSSRVLGLLFGVMEGQFEPERAAGFTGDIQYDLRASSGALLQWTMTISEDAARARPGPSTAPKLTLKLAVADFLRLAGRDLEPGRALLTGRLDLAGDFAVAARLGEMFGQPPPF